MQIKTSLQVLTLQRETEKVVVIYVVGPSMTLKAYPSMVAMQFSQGESVNKRIIWSFIHICHNKMHSRPYKCLALFLAKDLLVEPSFLIKFAYIL